jgi:hypothetical protein
MIDLTDLLCLIGLIVLVVWFAGLVWCYSFGIGLVCWFVGLLLV